MQRKKTVGASSPNTVTDFSSLSHILPSEFWALPSPCRYVDFNDFPLSLSLTLTFFSFFLKFSPQVVGFSESCVGLGKLNLTKKL